MKIYILISILSILTLPFAASGASCPSDFINTLKKEKAEILVCEITSKLLPGLSAFVVRNFQEASGERGGITIGVHKAKKGDGGKVVVSGTPSFEDTGMGERLLEFNYKGKNLTHLIADINGDSKYEWIIRSFSQPSTGIMMIKYYDKKNDRFETVLPYKSLDGRAIPENVFFITHISYPPKIDSKQISFKVIVYPTNPSDPKKLKTVVYTLKNGKFTKN